MADVVCLRCGINRRTLRKWIKGKEFGIDRLNEHRRRPLKIYTQITLEDEQRVLDYLPTQSPDYSIPTQDLKEIVGAWMTYQSID